MCARGTSRCKKARAARGYSERRVALVDDSGEGREAFMDMTAGTVGVVEIRVLVAVGIVEHKL